MQNANTPVTAKSAFESLKAAGYSRSFVQKLLPDWWDSSLFKTSAGVFQFSLILKQKLGLDVSFGDDGSLTVELPSNHASFKHQKGTKAEELNISAGLGISIARLAVFSVREPYCELSANPAELYSMVREMTGRPSVDFEGLLELCWSHGIPVLFLKRTPSNAKKMTGMAVKVEDRPAILLGFDYKQHSKQLFVLAHELGHIVRGHVSSGQALVDEVIDDVSEGLEGSDQSCIDNQELEADSFAINLIRNEQVGIMRQLPRQNSATALASAAMKLGKLSGVDQGHIILSYAKDHDDWIRANQALNFIEQKVEAVELVKQKQREHVELSLLSEEASEYLLHMQGFSE